MKIHLQMWLCLFYILYPGFADISRSDQAVDLVIEYEGNVTFGFKAFILPNTPGNLWNPADKEGNIRMRDRFGFFIGVKGSLPPKGKKYDFSQARAEEFYDSEFRGYSNKKYIGANGGVMFFIVEEYFYIYTGIGLANERQYRQYYDDTFTTWSKDYYITDGMHERYLFDVVLGGNVCIEPLVFSFGYSAATSGAVLGIGMRI